MAQYTKKTDDNGSVRYKDGSKFVGKDNVPQNIKDVLDNVAEGTIVDELGEVVDPTTETDEGSGDDDEVVNTPPATEDEDVDEDDSEDETEEDDESAEDEVEEEAPAPTTRKKKAVKIGLMGYPIDKDGKTVSVFSGVPHETVKNVGGHMVPMTFTELKEKSDTEIIEKLKKLGKI